MKRLTCLDISRLALCGGLFATTATFSLFMPGLSRSVEAAWEDSPKVVLDQAWQIVYQEYVDSSFNETDWLAVRQELLGREYTSSEEAYRSLREVLAQLEDPYTRFMDPEQYQSLTNQTSGTLSGVGIRLKADPVTQHLTISEPLPNSPALAAGVKQDDRLIAIDGVSTEGMDVNRAAELIRGEEGTEVTLTLLRGEVGLEVVLTRARIEVPSVSYNLRSEGSHQVGYIRLSQFTSHAAREMRDAIQALSDEGADAFVLDLRGNPGGLLHASIDIARMWLEEGTIVKTVDRDSHNEEILANRTALTELPLAILVDQNSASSSEILAGALQDNHRATLVGSQTFGKALVQSLHGLSDGSGLAVTIAHYYTPNGTDISKKGVVPDIVVSLSQDERRRLARNPETIATFADPQYSQAISFLETTLLANPQNQPSQLSSNELELTPQ